MTYLLKPTFYLQAPADFCDLCLAFLEGLLVSVNGVVTQNELVRVFDSGTENEGCVFLGLKFKRAMASQVGSFNSSHPWERG
jgi:hypothetical protein